MKFWVTPLSGLYSRIRMFLPVRASHQNAGITFPRHVARACSQQDSVSVQLSYHVVALKRQLVDLAQ